MIAGGAQLNNRLEEDLASQKHRALHVAGLMWRSMASRVGIRGRLFSALSVRGTHQRALKLKGSVEAFAAGMIGDRRILLAISMRYLPLSV